ncbi:MAG: M56 family metallopeptidase [Acidobacteria bacterium]|nr:M56 family metallopeptidase [Acidobacteriota bacterium]
MPVAEAAFDAGPFDPGGPVGASGLPSQVAYVVAHTAPGISRLPLLIWAIGCVGALGSLGVGILRFRKLLRSARPVADPSWHRQLGAVQKELGLHADVRLRLGGEVVTPMTGGLCSPVILLPASASGWSTARRTVVLTHELIHVRRRDALRQLLGRVVLALYWFHPLSWIASRLAAASREQACDEDVLAVGQRPSEYARHLVSLAASMNRRETVLSLPVVHPSQFEKGIMAIVRRDRPRRRGLVSALALSVVGVVGVTVAVANPVPATNAPATLHQKTEVEAVRPTHALDWELLGPGLAVLERALNDVVSRQITSQRDEAVSVRRLVASSGARVSGFRAAVSARLNTNQFRRRWKNTLVDGTRFRVSFAARQGNR